MIEVNQIQKLEGIVGEERGDLFLFATVEGRSQPIRLDTQANRLTFVQIGHVYNDDGEGLTPAGRVALKLYPDIADKLWHEPLLAKLTFYSLYAGKYLVGDLDIALLPGIFERIGKLLAENRGLKA